MSKTATKSIRVRVYCAPGPVEQAELALAGLQPCNWKGYRVITHKIWSGRNVTDPCPRCFGRVKVAINGE